MRLPCADDRSGRGTRPASVRGSGERLSSLPYNACSRHLTSQSRSQQEYRNIQHATRATAASAVSDTERFLMSTENPQNLDPITDAAGAHPVGAGVGAAGGALTGAAVGSLAGPLGTIAGGVMGAVAGGLAGKEVAEKANPTEGGAPSGHALGTGVGASAGALAGASVGSVGGPLGIAAGAALGGLAGGISGQGLAEVVNPHPDDLR